MANRIVGLLGVHYLTMPGFASIARRLHFRKRKGSDCPLQTFPRRLRVLSLVRKWNPHGTRAACRIGPGAHCRQRAVIRSVRPSQFVFSGSCDVGQFGGLFSTGGTGGAVLGEPEWLRTSRRGGCRGCLPALG